MYPGRAATLVTDVLYAMKSIPSALGDVMFVTFTDSVWFPACRSAWKSCVMGTESNDPWGTNCVVEFPSIE